MRSHLAVALAASALLLAATSARAAGEITDLAAAPSPAQAGQEVFLTVSGKGACPQLFVEFGDGTPDAALASVNFDKALNVTAPPHKYAAAKTYAIKAKPGKGCVGQASLSLVVQSQSKGGGPALSKGGPAVYQMSASQILDALAKTLAPKIKAKLGLVEPDSTFLLLGENFGAAPGKGEMTGEFGTVKLAVLDWKSKYAHLKVPGNIQGVKDHQASVMLTTAGGAKSEAYPVGFQAAREIKLLIASDVPSTACSNAAQVNSCNWKVVQSPNSSTASNAAWSGCVYKASICGWHEDIASPVMNGTDKYQVNLKNGWTLYDFTDFSSGSLYTEKVASTPTGFTEGAASWSFSVNWKLGKGQWATYTGYIWAKGPAGVPSK